MPGRTSLSRAGLLLLAAILGFAPLSETGQGVFYWVSVGGQASWAMARSETPLTGAACASLMTANASATAGDTVYLRGGTYRQALAPANSGTAEARIVFMAYPGETPVFTVTSDDEGRYGISLLQRNYIKIDGLVFRGCLAFFRISGSSYNEITRCTFENSGGLLYATALISNITLGKDASPGSMHNWIHHCTFTKYGEIWNGEEMGTVRLSANYLDPSGHTTVEDNVFSYGGHDCLDVGGEGNVVRNNVFHNEEVYFRDLWRNQTNVPRSGYFGNRNIHVSNSGNNAGTAYHTLIEGNRIGYAGTPPDDDGSCGIENAGAHTITRLNDIFGNGGMGYYSKMQGEYNSQVRSGSWARVYNNSIYHNGFGDPSIDTQFKHGICIWSYKAYNDWPQDVVIKNNIVYDNYNEWWLGSDNILPQVRYLRNFKANPRFVNPSLADKTSLSIPDLALQPNSRCIDAGISLTRASGAGAASKTLAVEDPLYFQDGTWGSSLAGLGADWIAVGAVDNVAPIESIDYAAKILVLGRALSWTAGAPVWLFRDSRGRRVLYGKEPDIGAHEWIDPGSPRREDHGPGPGR